MMRSQYPAITLLSTIESLWNVVLYCVYKSLEAQRGIHFVKDQYAVGSVELLMALVSEWINCLEGSLGVNEKC